MRLHLQTTVAKLTDDMQSDKSLSKEVTEPEDAFDADESFPN